jgi:flavin-dependent dehydrogenase
MEKVALAIMSSPSESQDPLCSTIRYDSAIERFWDVIIVGAGVAGSATAILAAQSGLKVLLVESKSFPREKVCGGCLNIRAQDALRRLGVEEELLRAGSVPLNELHVQVKQVGHIWSIPSLLSVRRSTLDTILVRRAIECGAEFLQNTTAVLPAEDTPATESIEVELRCIEGVQNDKLNEVKPKAAQARCVVIAAGLNRSALRLQRDWPAVIEPDSRLGAQALVELKSFAQTAPDFFQMLSSSRGRLHMLSSQHGYVGICLTDGELIDMAAALDPKRVSSAGGIRQVVCEILQDCGIQTHRALDDCHWMATSLLTRTSKIVAKPGVFLVGDALGYIEPFTGEGMSWALDNAEMLAPNLVRIVQDPRTKAQAVRDWEVYVQKQRRFRHRICRWVAKQARHPTRSQWVVQACHWIPGFRTRILKKAVQ